MRHDGAYTVSKVSRGNHLTPLQAGIDPCCHWIRLRTNTLITKTRLHGYLSEASSGTYLQGFAPRSQHPVVEHVEQPPVGQKLRFFLLGRSFCVGLKQRFGAAHGRACVLRPIDVFFHHRPQSVQLTVGSYITPPGVGIDWVLSFDPATDQCTHNKDSITWLLNVVFVGSFEEDCQASIKD